MLLAVLLFGSCRYAEGAEASLASLFQKRAWSAMDEAYKAKKEPAVLEQSLMANALRIQNRWAEAVAIMERCADRLPAELKPYADMTLLLGYENTGRPQDALKVAARLEKNPPEELRYYIAYAQLRLLGDSDPAGTKKALDRMLDTADSKERKISTLVRMLKLPGDQSGNAQKLLELQPTNKAAYDLLAARPKPWSAAANLVMGEYAYLKNDHKTAQALLGAVPQKAAGYRRATYYRAYSFYKTKRYAEALKLWGSLALSGNSWAESSVRRIATLAGRAEKASSEATLRRIVKTRKGKIQARAMFSLSGLVGDTEKKKLEDDLIQAYPDSPNTVKILWKRGWDSWNAKKYDEAVWYWKQVYAPGLDAAWKPRVLYWIAAARRAAGQEKEAQDTLSLLARTYPLSYYTFLACPGAITLLDGDHPELVSKPDILEQWGFVYYAKLRMQRPKATSKELYRSMRLADWLGESDDTSYAQARQLTRWFTTGTKLYRRGLEYLYPRPYRDRVDAACKKYGVEDNLVWSIMRQESAFKPSATSWVGASGLMQLMPGTAKDEAKRIGLKSWDIYDVKDNITMGTAHLARLGKSFDRNDRIMAAYNAGPGNARKWMADGKQDLPPDFWIEQVRFDETCDYIQRVSGNLETYRMLYGVGTVTSGDVSLPPEGNDETLPVDENGDGEEAN